MYCFSATSVVVGESRADSSGVAAAAKDLWSVRRVALEHNVYSRRECRGSFDGGDCRVLESGVGGLFRAVGIAYSDDRAGGIKAGR
jgi:hypothetical protein